MTEPAVSTLSPETEARLWKWASAGMGLLGLVGFSLSFATVSKAMEPSFGKLAFLVPAAIDLAIFVFTAMDLMMAYKGIRATWLRYIPWGLTAVTIYLNVADETDMKGRVAHAALPALWVIGVEVFGGAARKIYGIDMSVSSESMDKIRGSRWLLAPLSSARMWRRMVLHEQTSYRRAVTHWENEELARTGLVLRHGWTWRWIRKARLERVYLKHGRLDDLPGLPPLPGARSYATGGAIQLGGVTAQNQEQAAEELAEQFIAELDARRARNGHRPVSFDPDLEGVDVPAADPVPVQEPLEGLSPAGIDLNGAEPGPVADTSWPVRPGRSGQTTVVRPGKRRDVR